jgi:hypothetical protein
VKKRSRILVPACAAVATTGLILVITAGHLWFVRALGICLNEAGLILAIGPASRRR